MSTLTLYRLRSKGMTVNKEQRKKLERDRATKQNANDYYWSLTEKGRQYLAQMSKKESTHP